MQKLSQTEELARTLAAHARRKTLTPDQISRAMDDPNFDKFEGKTKEEAKEISQRKSK